MKLIALYSSTPGCGKSTIARYLETKHGYKRVSFADPMRAMLTGLYESVGLTPTRSMSLLNDKKDLDAPLPYSPTSRHLLRTLGTEWGRQCIGPAFWAEIWRRRASFMLELGSKVVCDDLRFPEELQAVADAGGITWKVQNGETADTVEHPSDGALDYVTDWDGLINNNASLHELESNIEFLLQL